MIPRTGLPEGKIQSWHRDRLAVVYVRQSTRQQVLDHGESTRLQYGLAERAVGLGWSRRRVLVIDEDLGRSGASAVDRIYARALRDAGTPVPQIAGKLTIKTGKNTGKHPSVASVYRALAGVDQG